MGKVFISLGLRVERAKDYGEKGKDWEKEASASPAFIIRF
jgi:hypothetical protein